MITCTLASYVVAIVTIMNYISTKCTENIYSCLFTIMHLCMASSVNVIIYSYVCISAYNMTIIVIVKFN